MGVECPAAMMQRALGEDGFRDLPGRARRGGQLYADRRSGRCDPAHDAGPVGQSGTGATGRGAPASCWKRSRSTCEFCRTNENILAMIKDDLREIRRKYGEDRRTEISGEEIGSIDLEDLITEETMVVSISHRGYIKRTPASVYRAQRRGGKGTERCDDGRRRPDRASVRCQHARLSAVLHEQGKSLLAEGLRPARLEPREPRSGDRQPAEPGRATRRSPDCRAVRDFDLPGHFLMMATRKGLVKKTPLEAYSRPKRGGIIAIKLREDDELVDVVVTKPGDEVVLATAEAWPFASPNRTPARWAGTPPASRGSTCRRATSWSGWSWSIRTPRC